MTRENGLKLHKGCLDCIFGNISPPKGLPSSGTCCPELVESLSLEIFKRCVNVVLQYMV